MVAAPLTVRFFRTAVYKRRAIHCCLSIYTVCYILCVVKCVIPINRHFTHALCSLYRPTRQLFYISRAPHAVHVELGRLQIYRIRVDFL